MGRKIAGVVILLSLTTAVSGEEIVYNGLSGNPTGQYSESNVAGPAFGDILHLNKPGVLTTLGLTLFNGGGGSIQTGTMLVEFFDSSTPYTGGTVTNPLLGSGEIPYDFTAQGGLASGLPDVRLFDFSALNIHLPADILIVQQFTLRAGDSTSNGVLIMPNPVVGSSPQQVFVSSGQTSPDLYTFTSGASQFGYYVEVVPDPVPEAATAALLLPALLCMIRRKAPRQRGA